MVDPVTFVATTAAAVAANKYEKNQCAKKSERLNAQLTEVGERLNNQLNEELRLLYPADRKLGKVYHRYYPDRSRDRVVDKYNWIRYSYGPESQHSYRIEYLEDIKGWCPEWGDPEIEIPKYVRELYACKYPANREAILNRPLEDFAVPHRPVRTSSPVSYQSSSDNDSTCAVIILIVVLFLLVGIMASY